MRFALGFLVGATLATFGPFAGALAGAALHERNLRQNCGLVTLGP